MRTLSHFRRDSHIFLASYTRLNARVSPSSSQPAYLRLSSSTTPRSRPAMDTSLVYAPERGSELADNVKDVLKEIEAVKPTGSDVSCLAARGWEGRLWRSRVK